MNGNDIWTFDKQVTSFIENQHNTEHLIADLNSKNIKFMDGRMDGRMVGRMDGKWAVEKKLERGRKRNIYCN
jgi:hypothetical protein